MAIPVSIAVLGDTLVWNPQNIQHVQLTFCCASYPQSLSTTYEDGTLLVLSHHYLSLMIHSWVTICADIVQTNTACAHQNIQALCPYFPFVWLAWHMHLSVSCVNLFVLNVWATVWFLLLCSLMKIGYCVVFAAGQSYGLYPQTLCLKFFAIAHGGTF